MRQGIYVGAGACVLDTSRCSAATIEDLSLHISRNCAAHSRGAHAPNCCRYASIIPWNHLACPSAGILWMSPKHRQGNACSLCVAPVSGRLNFNVSVHCDCDARFRADCVLTHVVAVVILLHSDCCVQTYCVCIARKTWLCRPCAWPTHAVSARTISIYTRSDLERLRFMESKDCDFWNSIDCHSVVCNSD